MLFVLAYGFVRKIAQISHVYLIKTAFQVIIAAGVMGLGVWWVDKMTNFIFAIIAGAIIYAVMVLLTRAIKFSELKIL